MVRRDILGLFAFLAICLAVGIARGFSAARNAAHWYQTVERPDFTLPSGMIAPFWTLLYLMIALSGWLIWREIGFRPLRPMIAYAVQLALNLACSLVYFDAQKIGLILAGAALLTLAIVWNIVEFWRVERISAILLVPYLVWMSFATTMAAAIWHLN